ncbi:MAG: ATP-binding cassette domain-containing protein [Bacteroidota bacterium]
MDTTTHQNISSPNTPFRGLGGIGLSDVGKRFNRDWIFRHVNYRFEIGRSYAITGPNGSGKSTLLQAIAGSLHLSEGKLEYHPGGSSAEKIEDEHCYQYLSIAAPYLELIEEMTALELLRFHHQFKSLINTVSIENILIEIGLEKAMDKQIRYFSSGMKQRLKLAQAVFSDTPVLLLDEPCTNLDKPGYELYHTLINKYCSSKLIVVSSNDAQEMDFCTEKISILDYK